MDSTDSILQNKTLPDPVRKNHLRSASILLEVLALAEQATPLDILISTTSLIHIPQGGSSRDGAKGAEGHEDEVDMSRLVLHRHLPFLSRWRLIGTN